LKPLNGGIPAIAKVAIKKNREKIGKILAIQPNLE
jgi:hypothetical protein